MTDMTKDSVKAIVQTQLEALILQAFNSAPDAIDKLIKAALTDHKVDRNGNESRYGSGDFTYLEYLVGDTIRRAARGAVEKVVKERQPEIEAAMRKAINESDFASEATKSLLNMLVGDEAWRCRVEIMPEEK